jgi:hypothetical protein
MHNNSFFKSVLFLVSILLFVSCDKEYSAVGDALIGENHFELAKYTSAVVAYNEIITPIESKNLPINALGIYDNPAFGKTTANFVTQLTLATVNPTFGVNPVIDSVYIDVPYFVDADSTVAITSAGNTYVLDSIYGKKLAKIKLSIYESGRYMGNQNGTAQTFYTNQNSEFDNLKIPYLGNRLNDDANKAQNDEFFFNPKQNTLITTDADNKVTRTYSAPSMRLKLNKAYFDSKIIHAPAGSLATNDVFINYFKGLYFKVEQTGSDKGSLAMMNFAKGTITIKYKEDTSATDPKKVDKTLVLNMAGNTVSLLEQSNLNADYTTATSNPNRVLGDEKLYLKGGEGSLAVIELFEKKDLIGYDANGNLTGPNGVSDELDTIRKNGWLINDANLVFTIDTNTMKNSYEPERIYLYDFTNNTTILDYYLGASLADKSVSKVLFGGYLTKGATSKKGVSYKIRITNHISNLVKNADVKNIKLGLVVTEDINTADMSKLKTPSTYFSEAPKASVMNPLGTVLYGGRSTSNPTDAKLLKLEIFYTKSK